MAKKTTAKVVVKAESPKKTVKASAGSVKLYNNMRCMYMPPNILVHDLTGYSKDQRQSIMYTRRNRLQPGQSMEISKECFSKFSKNTPKAFQALLDKKSLVVIDKPTKMDMRDAVDLHTKGPPKSIGGEETEEDVANIVETVTEPTTFLNPVEHRTVEVS